MASKNYFRTLHTTACDIVARVQQTTLQQTYQAQSNCSNFPFAKFINCIFLSWCASCTFYVHIFLSYVLQLANPLLDIEISVDAAEFLWSHGVISDELLAIKKKVCNDSRYFLEVIHNNISKECLEMNENTLEEVGNFTDIGDLTRPICLSSTTQSSFMGDLANAKVYGVSWIVLSVE